MADGSLPGTRINPGLYQPVFEQDEGCALHIGCEVVALDVEG
ncbi:MAG: hypothetical protein ACI8S6_001348 [Myxococcota bacterium]|jgi:hypothetical protein